ncbi:hypothetical protein ACH5RR_012450 [Cinchona calisaya]|uniref:Peptidase A1 domain-containing protein n=1 Tax=Cinchona calisaya TaxID=153742 RepID=A0ABD3A9A8_9GENT
MGIGTVLGVLTVVMMAVGIDKAEAAEVFSAKLMHRFSEEVTAVRVSRNGGEAGSLRKWSSEYCRRLLSSDLQRQKMKLGPQFEYLFPSQGSTTLPLGNDFGWLHYTWIDIGTPNVSFLVALDTGSDLLWVPCDCMQCAPLSASYYSSLDKDLSEYNPSSSNSSRVVPCSHRLCELGSNCKSPKEPCPYTVNYDTEDTSTSGLLVEDILHLVSGSSAASKKFVRAPIMMGCGSKQSGGYLSGVAPDGLMGLGLGNISIPSFLAKAGLSQNSFSLCFNDDDTGRIFFGDQGIASQHTTPILSSAEINAYIIGVETTCVESACVDQTNFKALVDSGTSFTFLPDTVYQKLVAEFNRQVNATKSNFEGYPWQYCYKSSSQESPTTPSLSLKFTANNSFVIINPVFIVYGSQGAVGFCLAVQRTDSDIGTIGQNFMTGYRMVFDRENMKLGWSRSTCKDLIDDKRMPVTPSSGSPNPLPTTEQQSKPNGQAVTPAVAGRTTSKSTATSNFLLPGQFYISEMLLTFWILACMVQ